MIHIPWMMSTNRTPPLSKKAKGRIQQTRKPRKKRS